MTYDNDPYYVCLCGIHVHRGAYLISIVGIILSTTGFVMDIASNHVGMAFSDLVSLLCYIGVFYANKYENPGFYLPHIIVNAINLSIGAIFHVVGLIGMFSVILHEKKGDKIDKKEAAEFAGAAVIFSLLFVVLYVIQIYLVHIVFRARRYMINVMQKQTSTPHFTQTNIPSVHNIL